MWDTSKQTTPAKKYQCGFCCTLVSSNECYSNTEKNGYTCSWIYICPECGQPTYFYDHNKQIPGIKPGKSIGKLPAYVSNLYDEIRNCHSVNAYNAVALLSRTLLSSCCVELGADVGLKFIEYVEWLDEENYIPKNSKHWVDKLRSIGNKQAHELTATTVTESNQLIEFIQMLLTLIFEYAKDDENIQS
ncbi:MAG: DUF4145 domain-containing protein [Mycoplasmataceae bacterium]|nr:DUF4145 domain-containing protein [Mycoplasmataceae bacterium]